MLTAVQVTNSRGDTLMLPLGDTSSGYSVRDIGGLDPVTAALSTSSLAQQDGALPQNARRDTRNITMKLGIEPDWAKNDVQSLRRSLYDYLLPKANVNLGFIFDGDLFALTSGQVESCESTLFSADPEVDVSIICYDPDFYGASPEIIADVSKIDTAVPTVVNYEGTSEAGLVFAMNVDRDLSQFVISNTPEDDVQQKMTVTGSFAADDIIVINTIPGQKALTLTRMGLTTSLLSNLESPYSWLLLKNGENDFSVVTEEAGTPFTMTYTPQYGGL